MDFVSSPFKIAIQYRHINTIQYLAICKDSISITNRRMQVTAKWNVELTFGIDTIQTIEAGAIQKQ